MRLQSAIFDMDGTLLDSMHIWREIGPRMLRARGIEPAPDLGERVAKELLIMKPVYDFFWKAQDTAGAESIHSTTALGLGEQ